MTIIAYSVTRPDGLRVGCLFDSDKAEQFAGRFCPYPDGSSGTTKGDLYLTDKGDWIKNHVALESGSCASTYVLISKDEAREWLTRHDYPEAAKRYFERPKGGRPSIGERVITTAPVRMVNEIATLSELYAEEFPETVRRLLGEALAHREVIGAPGGRDSGLSRP